MFVGLPPCLSLVFLRRQIVGPNYTNEAHAARSCPEGIILGQWFEVSRTSLAPHTNRCVKSNGIGLPVVYWASAGYQFWMSRISL